MGCICDRLCPHGAQDFDAWDASCGSAAAHDAHTKSEMISDKRTSVCLPIYLASRDFIFSCKDLSDKGREGGVAARTKESRKYIEEFFAKQVY